LHLHLDVAVPSGKSSLLAALLGEMYNEGGTVTVAGTTGYAAQDPWIQNATLRDNILMGYDYDKSR
jgi:ATP-binding cassette subfamily C (CFTR/MRP) protein 1